MRFHFTISPIWRPLFTVMGFGRKRSHIDVEDEGVTFHFGTAHETVSYSKIKSVAPRSQWIYVLGVGPKLGPDDGVSYVGSLDGVVQLKFNEPISLEIWLGLRHPRAKCVTVSVEKPDEFIQAIQEKIAEK